MVCCRGGDWLVDEPGSRDEVLRSPDVDLRRLGERRRPAPRARSPAARLVYFAAKNKGPIAAYTAISKPPYFTALALWPSLGTYGGGGLFVNDDHAELNHDPFHRELREGRLAPTAHAGLRAR